MRPDVSEALENGTAVVALESTIVAHGMPYPQNLETALRVEETIKKQGAIPATIAILDGQIKIGLTSNELENLARSSNVAKVSGRDIAFTIAQKKHGATTVAATMRLAKLAGIKVFATGGIGGVHRKAEKTFDISADLIELAHNDTVVICAGAKSILDIPLTLEYLETHQVSVVGFKTKYFPAFFSRSSKSELTMSGDSIDEIAQIIHTSSALKIPQGIIVANPIPEEFSISPEDIDKVIESALLEADRQGIVGKNITPFLLSEITKKTAGRSLEANIQLVLNNALVGAQIANKLAHLNSIK
jgi:pseudouridine-5'-phosphate glycosidase